MEDEEGDEMTSDRDVPVNKVVMCDECGFEVAAVNTEDHEHCSCELEQKITRKCTTRVMPEKILVMRRRMVVTRLAPKLNKFNTECQCRVEKPSEAEGMWKCTRRKCTSLQCALCARQLPIQVTWRNT